MFVSNAIDNFDASLRKNIYRFRQRVYKIDNNLMKCLNNCKDILNGPMWSSWSRHCTVSVSRHTLHLRVVIFFFFYRMFLDFFFFFFIYIHCIYFFIFLSIFVLECFIMPNRIFYFYFVL